MRNRAQGFSLIECVLALGVLATVLVAVMGLLPAGLESMRAAAQKDTETLILDRLMQRAQQGVVVGDTYYDANGAPLAGASSNGAFAARVESATAPLLPGDQAPALRCLRITISDRVAGNPFADPRHLHVRQLLVAPAKGGAP